MNTESVESYLRDGCGRCSHFRLPTCKVHRWTDILEALRALVRATSLREEMKWGSPCYTHEGKNVIMLVSLKAYCALQFFRGAELADPTNLLEAPGPNSRSGRLLKFRSLAEFDMHRAEAVAFVAQAIALAEAGAARPAPVAADPIPDELARRLADDPTLDQAFHALTPGRRRSHLLHIAGAKQPQTRERRVEGCVPAILAGRGHQER
jgi:uncharacterized protein YdeI (YjbR/CyaY-like superfamily)